MPGHHQLDITVSGKGELDVKVHYREEVPDLLSRFSDEVRARAMRFVWWKTRYERRLLRAIRLMPPWAQATVRQHILHERATRIEAKLKQQVEKRRLKEAQKSASIVAHHVLEVGASQSGRAALAVAKQVVRTPSEQPKVSEVAQVHSEAKSEQLNGGQLLDDTRMGWSSATRETSGHSLTEQFATSTSALKATPRPERSQDRSR